MNRIGLYLDDERFPTEIPPTIDRWEIVRNYEDFKKFIINFVQENKELPVIISFDHDLADEHVEYYLDHQGQAIDYNELQEKTGLHCAKWLTELCDKNNLETNYLSVHSHNPIGAHNIMHWLNYWLKGKNKMDRPCFLMKYKHTLAYENKVRR